jgi:hypothetical protein
VTLAHNESPVAVKVLPLNSPIAVRTVNFPGTLYDLLEHGGKVLDECCLTRKIVASVDEAPGTYEWVDSLPLQPARSEESAAMRLRRFAKPFFMRPTSCRAKGSPEVEDIASLFDYNSSRRNLRISGRRSGAASLGLSAAVMLPFLAGCHADVTFQFDLHRNGSALATTREVMDDQLYQLALNQNAGSDPFGIERLQRDGWSVTRALDQNGNHIVTISKLLSRRELSNPNAATALRGAAPPFTSLQISRVPGFFVERDSLSATVPALLPFALSTLNRPSAAFATEMLASVVALHLELRAPGRVLATNGEATPAGFTRWDLSLGSPTNISYSVRIVRIDEIFLLVLVVLAMAALGYVVVRVLRRGAYRAGSG